MVSYTSSSEAQKQQQLAQSAHHLHSVQRPPASRTYKKPLNMLAQLASGTAQPRVYNVKPIHFRELVQRLTGASSSPGLCSHQPHPPPQSQPQPQPPLSVPPYLLRPQIQSQIGITEEEQVPYKVHRAFAAVPEERQLFLDKEEGGEASADCMLENTLPGCGIQDSKALDDKANRDIGTLFSKRYASDLCDAKTPPKANI
ncbi:hypothetical protein Cgig2_009546 [Carnegiea gigantea]|uniref:VQ domain-containing protein n=1 Tax=Carnegiea gigantea TaxID=171969 RepID=A0A9Q1QF05_9CARY|nr:hypothetical protein Cgig2_009546 [Carnegiea gigantea]